jgi:hypothetical protein
MPHEIDHDRRHFFGVAAGTLAAGLAVTASAKAQSGNSKSAKIAATKPGTNTSFGTLKQIDAGLLNVGYAEDGPADGPAVILLHGWPYDIHSFADVTPLLARAGHRASCPTSAVTARPNSWPARRSGTANPLLSPPTSSL